jgi:hypothetical protein
MAANYVLLERIELNASAASITFSNIPQSGYTDLKVVVSARSDNTNIGLVVKPNGLTTNISTRNLEGNGSGASSYTSTNIAGYIVPSSSTANTFGNTEIYIPNYTSSNYKSISSDSVNENNATAAYSVLTAWLWSSTAAITSLVFSSDSGTNNFVAGSTFSLYGLAAVGTTPAIAPKASGGNITTDGTYWIHTFLTSGTFTPATNLTCDYLVVAGGGSGGGAAAGGGGAGGFRTASSAVTATSYTVTVGAGGASVTNSSGNTGSDSTFNSITSAGGGGGGGAGFTNNAKSGGSGGGSNASYSSSNPSGGAASPSGQGNAGGSASGSLTGGAGGGGAGSAGTSVTGVNGGAGGAGLANSYSGTSTYYAGGGGGSGDPSGGAGGTGGGGGTTGKNTASSGTANTGGGGGATWDNSYASGAGGSGLVIIRYSVA